MTHRDRRRPPRPRPRERERLGARVVRALTRAPEQVVLVIVIGAGRG